MLTKTVKIGDSALQVIAGMEWGEEYDGRVIGKITGGQLDRKLYVEVNKGLAALGGKWDKRVGGHVYAIDPREGIADLLDNGQVLVEKDGFFETPRPVALAMLSLLQRPIYEPILEPEAGLGALARVIQQELGVMPDVCEKNNLRRNKLADDFPVICPDFFDLKKQYCTIIMNPPFEQGQDIAHVMHGFDNCLFTSGQLVSVASAGVKFRQEQKYRTFRALVQQHGRIVDLPPNSFKESGTGVNTCLVYLRK